jgi:hypothetical protein
VKSLELKSLKHGNVLEKFMNNVSDLAHHIAWKNKAHLRRQQRKALDIAVLLIDIAALAFFSVVLYRMVR